LVGAWGTAVAAASTHALAAGLQDMWSQGMPLTHKHTETHTDTHTYTHTDTHTYKQTYIHTYIYTVRLASANSAAHMFSVLAIAPELATADRPLVEAVELAPTSVAALLLPRLCLNRFYVAPGVKHASQHAWQVAVGQCGKSLLCRIFSHAVSYYVEMAHSTR
jgi:hypothetical protein